MRGWIRGNTKIGPVLDVKACHHQGRNGVEIMIESLFRDRTVSCVRIVNGIGQHVNETSEEVPVTSVQHRVPGKPVATTTKPTATLSHISIPVRERNWIKVKPERYREDCFAVSKAMITLLRHNPSMPREDDGAVRFDENMEEFEAEFDGTSQWSINAWITFLAKDEDQRKSSNIA